MALSTLTVDLILKAGGFESDMGRAARTAQKRGKEIEDAAKKIGIALGTAIVAGATAAAVAIKSAIDRADELSKAAQKIGVTTESLSRLAYAADLSDVSLEQLQGGLGKLVKYQAEAAQGGKEAAATFEAFNIAVKDGEGNLRGTEAVLQDFAEVFAALPDGPEKTALALRVFGKSGAELIPLLNSGADGLREMGDEAERLGLVIGTQAGKEAEQFNDLLTTLKGEVVGLATQVATRLLPDLIDLVVEFRELIGSGEGVAQTADKIVGGIRAISSVVAVAIDGIQGLVSAYIAAGNAVDAYIKGGPIGKAYDFFTGTNKAALDSADAARGAGIAWAQAGSEVDQAMAKISGTSGGQSGARGPSFSNVMNGTELAQQEAARKAARGLLANPAAKTGSVKAATKSAAVREAEQLQELYDRTIAQQKEQLALYGQTGEAAQARYDTEFGALSKLTEAQKAAVVAGAEANDANRIKVDLAKEEAEIADQREKDYKTLISDLQFEADLIGKTNAQRAAEIELRRLGISLSTEEGAARAAEIESLVMLGEERAKQIAGMDEVRNSAVGLFVDLTDGVGSARDAFDDFIDNMRMRVLQLLGEKLIEKLFGAFGTAGGGGTAGAFGTILGSVFGGARAAGGPVTAGKAYVVGEKRPELFVPKASGVIVPSLGMGGSKSVNVSINLDTKGQPVTRETQQQIAMAAGRAASESLARNR